MPRKPIGSVLHVTPSRLIIVKAHDPNNLPRIGDTVISAGGEYVGVVSDIIGPIEEPYIVVKPKSPIALSIAKPSTVLYVQFKVSKRRTRKRRRALQTVLT